MELIIFGLTFGLFIGLGLFMLIIYPALKERREEQKKNDES